MTHPECFDQSGLNDLVRHLDLPKELVELLAFMLNKKHVFKLGTNVPFYRHGDKEFRWYTQEDGAFVTCIDIRLLLSELGIASYNPDEWRLFTDSSKTSLKSVLLHNGNMYGLIPIGHSLTAKENYEVVKKVLVLLYIMMIISGSSMLIWKWWVSCLNSKVATLIFHAFFVCGIVVQKTSTGSNGNGQNATFLELVG